MATEIPFEPRRFQSAAEYYLTGRPAYAPLLVQHVAELCGLGTAHRVMDLGCGPAQLAIAFAPFAGEVVAIDPEPEMLRIAAENAARSKVAIRFIQGSSYDLASSLGIFRLVAIGRAFHWMDRAQTLARLDEVIEAEGAVALFSSHHPELPDNRWRQGYEALIEEYAKGDAGRSHRKSPDWVTHEAVLLDSAFNRLERLSVIERRDTPLDRFVDRALSLSSTSRSRIGPEADRLAEKLRDVMAGFARDGFVTEVVESQALIARRSLVP